MANRYKKNKKTEKNKCSKLNIFLYYTEQETTGISNISITI
jgi:hypothetical protein